MLTQILASIAAIAAALTAYLIYKQVLKMNESIVQNQMNQEILLCLELSKRYDDIYIIRNKLMNMDFSWNGFNQKYSTINSKLNSKEWKMLRKVAGFFELVGSVIKRKYVKAEIIFDFMYVQPQLWENVSNLVYHMREEYLPDLWIHWEYLIEEFNSYRKR